MKNLFTLLLALCLSIGANAQITVTIVGKGHVFADHDYYLSTVKDTVVVTFSEKMKQSTIAGAIEVTDLSGVITPTINVLNDTIAYVILEDLDDLESITVTVGTAAESLAGGTFLETETSGSFATGYANSIKNEADFWIHHNGSIKTNGMALCDGATWIRRAIMYYDLSDVTSIENGALHISVRNQQDATKGPWQDIPFVDTEAGYDNSKYSLYVVEGPTYGEQFDEAAFGTYTATKWVEGIVFDERFKTYTFKTEDNQGLDSLLQRKKGTKICLELRPDVHQTFRAVTWISGGGLELTTSNAPIISYTTSTTKVNETQSLSEQIKLYPQPVNNGILNISGVVKGNVEVYNLIGSKVLSQQLSNGTIDVSSLNKGMYAIKITSGDNYISKMFMVK